MADKRPNILLFTTDQHRGDHLGLAGHPILQTPNVDAWVNHGAYFPNAYTEIPSTTGARRVLHSGKGSYDCGLIGYSGVEWMEPNTLAAVLAADGYHCINVGWRNMHPRRKLYGFHTVVPHDLSRGDDDYWDWLIEQAGPYAHERGHGCDANGWLARPWHLEERLHPTVWTNDVTLEHLAKRDPTRPFFIWCSHMRPHSPYDPPQYFWDMYIDRELPEIPVGDWAARHDVPVAHPPQTAWRGRLTAEQNQRMRAAYMGVITHIDYDLGRLLQRMARGFGALQDTLCVFTADHGDMMGDHHLHRKCYAYEGSARIPFVIQYPHDWDLPSGTFEHVVGLQDVMPTILEAAGAEAPEGVTGRSVFDAVRGKGWREFLHGEHSPCYNAENAMQYLTDGREKYIYFPVTGAEQLFDLTADRREQRDLAKSPKHAKRVVMWRKRLIEILHRRGDGFSDGRKLLRKEGHYGAVVQGHPTNPK
ncbi:MAG TPA: sulfatase-like hydrolase/transferase [Vicinamibacterales bacterium]|nr:sulfatase-like hydrolase/transferase [Vicinamibacterales bacterium]